VRRREFIITVAGCAALLRPYEANAQQRVARLGYLGLGYAPVWAPRIEALRTGLRDLGYIEGKNLVIEFRWAETVEQLPNLAAELVRMNVDVIFAAASTLVEAARHETATIPIVFANHADPVGTGHVVSLARPGGNATGLSMLMTELAAKELELLREALPRATRLGVLWNPTTPSHVPALKAVKAAGEKVGVALHRVPARAVDDFQAAFGEMERLRVDGCLVVGSPLFATYRETLAAQALKHRLPLMAADREGVEAGGLIGYAADIIDLYRRAALYIDKVLKGNKPADLPVEQASKYELVINLKTAKALGVTIPDALLVRADAVIE
jgi:putative ABC transport system substrate-binding protein